MSWIIQDNKLVKEFRFKNFEEAFAFMQKVAIVAEKLNHHPNWYNSYNYLRIELSTHDKGNIITEKDYQLAKEIDNIML
ncbi:MAG: 4a-hydroxytetrahydrobiopterin dehydratase [Bacteroidia bacterium]